MLLYEKPFCRLSCIVVFSFRKAFSQVQLTDLFCGLSYYPVLYYKCDVNNKSKSQKPGDLSINQYDNEGTDSDLASLTWHFSESALFWVSFYQKSNAERST